MSKDRLFRERLRRRLRLTNWQLMVLLIPAGPDLRTTLTDWQYHLYHRDLSGSGDIPLLADIPKFSEALVREEGLVILGEEKRDTLRTLFGNVVRPIASISNHSTSVCTKSYYLSTFSNNLQAEPSPSTPVPSPEKPATFQPKPALSGRLQKPSTISSNGDRNI